MEVGHITRTIKNKTMTNIQNTIAKIEPERVYSLTELVRKGLIPPIKSYPTANRAVLEDRVKPEAERTLNAQIIGEGRGRTIRIEGRNLIKYLQNK